MKRPATLGLTLLVLLVVGLGLYWLPSSVPGHWSLSPAAVTPVPVRPIFDPDERLPAPLPSLPAARLEIVGVGPPGPLKLGDPVAVTFLLKNAGEAPQWVVRSLDGSCFGRSPRCHLEIWDEAGKPEIPKPPRGCGFQNPLEEGDFTLLGAGQTLPESLRSLIAWWKPSHPGVYSVRMTYDTTEEYLQSWAGSRNTVSPQVRELLRLIPRGRFRSEPVKVSIVE